MIAPRVALAVVVVSTAVGIVLAHPHHSGIRFALMVAGYAGLAVLLILDHRRPWLTARTVLVSVGLLLAVAVIAAPQGSRDIWSYVMYGRIVSEHGDSPYRFVPDDFAHDPLLPRVDPRWQKEPSVYGPAFVAGAAGLTFVADESPLADRLLFQLLAAGLVMLCVVLVGRATGDPAAMVWLGLNPLIALFIANPGHNDLLVGAPVLIAVLVAARRPMLAGLLLGVATLVKFVALVAMAALAVSVWRASGRRAFCLLVGTGGAVALAGYAVAGGMVAIRPLMIASAWHSSQSLATGILKLGARVDAPLMCEIAAAAAICARLLRRPPNAAWLVAAALALYLMAAPWVLPWYVAWELPVAALVWRTPLGFVVTLQSALLCIASVNVSAVNPVIFQDAVSGAAHVLLPVLDVVGLIVLGFTDWLAPRADRAEPAPSQVAVAHS